MANTYIPRAGFAQSEYVDQMGTALPGQLTYASDQWLIDSYVVAPATDGNGIEAGLGFVAAAIPDADRAGARAGLNIKYAGLPAAGATAADFAGITVRNQQMDSNVAGHACWFAGRMCNGIRANRIGGRIWVQLSSGSAAVDAPVFWIISDTTGHGKPIGSFAGAALGADTVQLTNAVFKSAADSSTAATIAVIELAEIGD